MIIALIGASGSGKSTIEKELTKYGYSKIISYTTRKPRNGEINGIDYHFINLEMFTDMCEQGMMAEYDEYSQKRIYGTLKSSYQTDENKVVVLTPNGFRNIKKNCPNEKIITVLVSSDLGVRVKRYIDRCGADKFNYDDMNEINARVNRDFGMFLGLENEVDLVVKNNNPDDIGKCIGKILEKVQNI